VVLDLKATADRDRFRELVAHADIVVENFSTGVMDRFGLSYESLQADNPRLIYAALRGFGDPRGGASPYADWPAFDVVAQAMGGFLGITGTTDGTPVKSGPGVGDLFPGVLLAVGILAALHHRNQTGTGQFLDVAMYDAVLSLCERIVYQHSYTGAIPVQQGNGHPLFCPFDILPTSDGWIALAANDQQWAIVARTIGRPEMAADDMLVEVPQPGSDRPVTVAGQPIKFGVTPAEVTRRAPTLGEHDVETVVRGWRDGE